VLLRVIYLQLTLLCCRFVIGEVTAALLSVHDLGLCFNDLKPENILITEIGHIKVCVDSVNR
jgi:serine/threonine protein kinase